MTLSPPQAHSTLDMDISNFDISETNLNVQRDFRKPSTTPRRYHNNRDILSPRIPTAEVNRHFTNFSSHPNNNNDNDFTDDSLLDPSIELGRGGKSKNLSAVYNNNNNNNRRGGGGGHSSDEDSPPSKVTNKNPTATNMNTPKVSDGKYDFVVPSAYRDDDSFFGNYNNIEKKNKNNTNYTNFTNGTHTNNNNTKYTDMNLPDITGLSSIFSSENGQHKKKSSHKQIMSVPLDPDDQALFTAFGSFQKKVEQLEKSKQEMNGRVNELEKEVKELNNDLGQERSKCDDMERRAKKYKSMAVTLKEQMEKMDNSESVEKLTQERDEALKIAPERDSLKNEVDDLKKQLNELREQLSHGEAKESQIEAEKKKQREEEFEQWKSEEEKRGELEREKERAREKKEQENEKRKEVRFESPHASANSSNSSELGEIKDLLIQLLNKQVRAESQDSQQPTLETELEVEQTEPESENEPVNEPIADDSVIGALQHIVEKIKTRSAPISSSSSTGTTKTTTAKTAPEFPLSSNTSANSSHSHPQPKQTKSQTRIPKLVDRVIDSLPPTCEICSAKPTWSPACDHHSTMNINKQFPNQNQNQNQPSFDVQTNPAYPSANYPNSAFTQFNGNHWDDEVSIRPSMSAEQSIKLILEGMGKEFAVLKDQYTELTSDYSGQNPTRHRKKRQQVAENLKALMNDMEVKADQIYALYDVMAEKNINIDEEWVDGEFKSTPSEKNGDDTDDEDEINDDESVASLNNNSNNEDGIGILGRHQWIHT